MGSLIQVWAKRLQRTAGWSSSRQSWKERGSALVLIVGAGGLGWYGRGFSTAAQAGLWALLVGLWALLARAGWLHLFGPLLLYDLVRTIRRSRIVLVRITYTLFLFMLLLFVYLIVFYDSRDDFRALFTGVSVAPASLANFASGFSYGFSIIQLFAVILLVPAYTAGAVAEERERGTLEAMLVTDLRNREIVFGMVLSRLGVLMLVVLGGLPMLAGLQFLGGIDPNIILAAFATTAMTMVGLAGVSVLCSVYARKARRAIVQTYLIFLAYLVLSGLSEILLVPALGLASFPSTDQWTSPITLTDLVNGFNAGNFITVAFEIAVGLGRGGRIDLLLANAVRGYTWFHGLAAVGCLSWATLRLRAIVLRDDAPPAWKASSSLLDALGLGIGNRPMIWKALVVDARTRRGLRSLLLNGCLIAALFWPGIRIVFFFGRYAPAGPQDALTNLLNLWIRGASALIGSFMLLGVAVRASGAISGERERQTLDGLLATTLSNRTMLFSKWLGSILNDRWSWFWLAVLWCVGIFTQALHPLAVAYFVLAWLVYATVLAGVGLWFSVANRSSRRALIGTLVCCVVASVFFLLAAFDLAGGRLTTSDAYSLLPPATLGLLTFSPDDFREWTNNELQIRSLLYPSALAVCASFAAAFLLLAQIRFRQVTGRELLRTERAPLPVDSVSLESQPGGAEHSTPGYRARWASALHLLWRASPRLLGRALLLLLPVALIVGWHFWSAAAVQTSLQDALAETDVTDPGWRREEIEALRPIPPDEQNSTVRFLKIKQPSRQPNLVEWTQKAAEKPPELRLDSEMIHGLKTELESCQKLIEELRELAYMPHGEFPRRGAEEVEPSLDSNLWNFIEKANLFAILLQADILLRNERDSDNALISCRAHVNLGRALGRDPIAASSGARPRIVGMALPAIGRQLARGEPSEEGLAALQGLLEDEAAQPLFVAKLRGRRASLDYVFRKAAGNESGFNAWRRQRRQAVTIPDMHSLISLLRGSYAESRLANLRESEELIAAAQLPPVLRTTRFRQIELAWQSRSLRVYVPVSWELMQQEKYEAELQCTILALAVERYRRKHGTWPVTLAALTPTFLRAVPIDPMDGNPIRYRRLPDGVVIYSIGLDRVDNGGTISPSRSWLRAGTDLGVRMWDVGKRGQAPASKPGP